MNEAKFHETVDLMVRDFLKDAPVVGTFMGVHDYDSMLADYRPEAISKRMDLVRSRLAELEAAGAGGFSREGKIDHILVTQLLRKIIMDHEKSESHRRNPGVYTSEVMEGIVGLMIKDFAPLEERLQSAAGRTGEAARVLGEARLNLDPPRVPRVWAELALEQARMGSALFEGILPTMARDYPELQNKLLEAGGEASRAMQDYAVYLEEEVLPEASGEFAVGEEYFNTLLREMHMVDYDAGELLETGHRLFKETADQIEAVAREIDPSLSVEQILDRAKSDHPTAESLLDDYRRAMEEARQYVIKQDLATIPEGEKIKIIETPFYLRPIIPYAAYIPPGIFEQEMEGIFLVTPPDETASPEEKEEKLKGQPYSKIPVTALHEAYPGHHLQLVWSARYGTTARKTGMMISTLFVEGWAFYCEELMEQIGYISSPVQRLGRLNDQLWRAARIIIDVSLHCRGMSIEEAINFLVEQCRLQPGDAKAEVRRYTKTPTQPQSYLMGKLEILKIVEEYRKRYPDVTMREMHDAILACGSLPPRLMRRQLFE